MKSFFTQLTILAVCWLSAHTVSASERDIYGTPERLKKTSKSEVQETVDTSRMEKPGSGSTAGISAPSQSSGSGAIPVGDQSGQMGVSKQEQQGYSGFYHGQGSGGMSSTATIIHENSKRKEEGRPAMSAYEECITRAGGDPAAAVNCAPHGNNPGSGAGYGDDDLESDTENTTENDEQSSGSWFNVDDEADDNDDSGNESGSQDDDDKDQEEDDSSDEGEKNTCEPEDGESGEGDTETSGNPMDGDTGMNVPLSEQGEAVAEKLTGGKAGTGLAVQQGTVGGTDDPRTNGSSRGDTSGGIGYTPGTAGSPDDGRGIDDPVYSGPSGKLKMTTKEQLGGTIDRTGR